MNTQSDHFLRRFASAPFPEAVEHNERELAEIAQLEASLRSKQPSGAATDDAAMFALSQQQQQQHQNRAKDLSEAIESLPEILQRKATLETHTNLMQAVMKQIAARDIPSFFELEQALLTGGVRHMDRAAVLTLLRDGTKGSLHDKARLLALLAALGDSHSLSKVGAEEYDAALTQGCAAMLPAVGANAAAGSGSTTPVPSAGSGQGKFFSDFFGVFCCSLTRTNCRRSTFTGNDCCDLISCTVPTSSRFIAAAEWIPGRRR